MSATSSLLSKKNCSLSQLFAAFSKRRCWCYKQNLHSKIPLPQNFFPFFQCSWRFKIVTADLLWTMPPPPGLRGSAYVSVLESKIWFVSTVSTRFSRIEKSFAHTNFARKTHKNYINMAVTVPNQVVNFLFARNWEKNWVESGKGLQMRESKSMESPDQNGCGCVKQTPLKYENGSL